MEICIGMGMRLNSVYDVIEALCRWRCFTIRDLSNKTSITYSTLATILKRRPEKVSVVNLALIGQVFSVEWYVLLGRENDPELLEKYNGRNLHGARISASMDEETIKSVLEKIIGDDYRKVLDRIYDFRSSQINDRMNFANANSAERTISVRKGIPTGVRARFDACVDMVFDNFNEAGVVEAMRYILALSQDPKFCKSSSPTVESEDRPNFEDTV